MNKFKKLLTYFILTIFTLSSISYGSVNASRQQSEVNKLVKEVIISKFKLNNTFRGKKYVKQIDGLIGKLESNKKITTLEKILTKIEGILSSVQYKNDKKSNTIKNILKYLKAKLQLAIYNIESSEPELSIEELFTSNLSSNEKQKVEDEIVTLQLNLFNKTTNLLEKLTNSFEKLNNYEDKGDFNMGLKVDHEQIGKIDYNFNFNDYKLSNSNFDSQLKGKISSIIKASNTGENIDIDIEFNSILDFISKDGNAYLLLEKLNIIDKDSKQGVKNFIEKVKKLATKNKYIKFGNQDTKKALNILNSLTPSRIIADGNDILSKPMFEAYKKDGKKYLLKPTKYACDKLKGLSGRFDPFNANNICSDKQYKNILRDLSDTGELYIIIGSKNKIGFNGKDSETTFNGSITYSNDKILELNTNIFPDQNKYPKEGFNLEYKGKAHLNIDLYAEKGDIDYSFKSKLDLKNNFKELDFKGKTTNNYTDFNAQLKLQNKKITGNYEFNSSRYNWETKKYKKDSIVYGSLEGNIDSSNSVKSLKIETTGTKLENNLDFLKLTLDYKPNDIYFGFLLNDDKDEIFKTDISLKNKIITGLTTIGKNTGKSITVTHSGKYEKDFLEFNNLIELEKNPFTELSSFTIDAKNAKVTSDLRILTTIIEIGITKGDFELKDIVMDGNKINFVALKQNGSDFLHPDGSDYLVFVDGSLYQLFGYTTSETGDKTAVIKGNYFQASPTDNVGLAMYDGKYIKNGDLIEEGNIAVVEEEEEKVSGNLNFATDLRNNKRNLDFYVDVLIGEKRILEFNLENKSTRVYKDIDIKTPTNTVDYREVFDEEDNRYY